MRVVAKALGLVLVLLLGGCLVETENTLADPDPKAKAKAKAKDDKLVGSWYSAESGEVVMFQLAADESGSGTYHAVYAAVRAGAEKPVDFEHYKVWLTVLNGQNYLNVVRTGGTGTSPKTMIAAYDHGADGTLALRLMDMKFVAAAIEAGKLKGRVKKGQYVDEVTITATRAELAAFVAASRRDELFATKTGALHKLADTRK